MNSDSSSSNRSLLYFLSINIESPFKVFRIFFIFEARSSVQIDLKYLTIRYRSYFKMPMDTFILVVICYIRTVIYIDRFLYVSLSLIYLYAQNVTRIMMVQVYNCYEKFVG